MKSDKKKTLLKYSKVISQNEEIFFYLLLSYIKILYKNSTNEAARIKCQ